MLAPLHTEAFYRSESCLDRGCRVNRDVDDETALHPDRPVRMPRVLNHHAGWLALFRQRHDHCHCGCDHVNGEGDVISLKVLLC